MARTLIIGDIHGGLKALKQAFERCQLQSDDHLIFLGDYVDGWSESAQVMDLICDLKKNYTCICIKGNHDVWAENWLRTGVSDDIWLSNGGQQTIKSYDNYPDETKKNHCKLFSEMPYYYIDQENRLFIHAGFTSMHGPVHEFHNTNFSWDRTLWELALALDPMMAVDDVFYPRRLRLFEEIFIGHTPTVNYFITTPMRKANVWNVDTGAAFNGPLTIMDAATKAFWQSDKLPSLYPEENGRNRL